MRLKELRLVSFRSHERSELVLGAKVNLLFGGNGAGKTNVLEAVHCLCLSKSFLTSTDGNILKRDASHYEVEGSFSGERRTSVNAKLVYVPNEGKRLFLNGAPLERMAMVVGELPVVVLSPADHALTADGPEERRRFLNATLSQASPIYLDDLLKYRRVLKQRNSLLFKGKSGMWMDPGTLGAWNEELISLGSRIVYRRKEFLGHFAEFLAEAYCLLDAVGEEPTMEYVTVDKLDGSETVDAIADLFRNRLARLERGERQKGRTLAGPHRDEVIFRLGEFEVRPFASQGQHRTVGLALRLATALYLNDRLDEMPILLLDDVFGTLDAKRAEIVVDLLKSDAVGQSIVTAARPEAISDYIDLEDDNHRAYEIHEGNVVSHETLDLDVASTT